MEKSGTTKQVLAGLAATLSLGSGGFHCGWTSPTLPKLMADDSDIPITSDQSSSIVSLFIFGCALGPFISAPLVDRCGRKLTLLLGAIPFLISTTLIGTAETYWWLIAARFIAGLATGMTYAVTPMYLGEIADDRIRGALGTMINQMLNAGILMTYSVGPWVSRGALAGLGGAFTLAFGLVFIWMPESPYYLLMKNKPESAKKSILWLKGSENINKELEKIQENIEFDKKNAGSIKELVMKPGNRKALFIMLGLMVAQQFSGIAAVISYCSLIFEASGSSLDSSISVIIIGVVQFLSGVLTIFVVDLAGRRPLLLLSTCGASVFLAGEALYFQLQAAGTDVTGISWLPVTAMVGYIIVYTIGLGCLPYVVLSEIFPCNVKALATLFTGVSGATGGIAVSKLYQIVADEFGIHMSFWGFTVFAVLSAIFIYFILPETKQRSLRSIQDEFHKVTQSTVELEKSEMA